MGGIADPRVSTTHFKLAVFLKVVVDGGIVLTDSEVQVKVEIVAFRFDLLGDHFTSNVVPRVELEGELGAFVIIDGGTPEVEFERAGQLLFAVDLIRDEAAVLSVENGIHSLGGGFDGVFAFLPSDGQSFRGVGPLGGLEKELREGDLAVTVVEEEAEVILLVGVHGEFWLGKLKREWSRGDRSWEAPS